MVISNCDSRKSNQNRRVVYVDIYGNCNKGIKLVAENDVIYQIDTFVTKGIFSVRKGPLIFNDERVKITFKFDDKDTTFVKDLDNKNYWMIGYSISRNEFQFTTYDSVTFFRSTLDDDHIIKKP